ncbi:Diacylglycerol kinase [Methylophaga frappieri]|uniref:Diacylglycerol kinase n=1 Tax=Methylophaga frappieri (strain ATCC BAA-2434 / DSM 25690 / JAM7) TaxID=754477 RepID=I1YJH2_METFJ|nr:diacylglycerol kinase [Methylophaga frappieri]AFJ03065.1 Diacylglycerol kinase [Methylophaga frappieri]
MEKNTGVKRLFFAFIYSMQGLYAGIRHESAFRQEFIGLILLVGVSFFLNVSPIERFAMISVLLAVLIVEALNSAIECVVDRVSTDVHKLSGRAKDYGSLAVLLTLIIAAGTWLLILLD